MKKSWLSNKKERSFWKYLQYQASNFGFMEPLRVLGNTQEPSNHTIRKIALRKILVVSRKHFKDLIACKFTQRFIKQVKNFKYLGVFFLNLLPIILLKRMSVI